jgi:glyoxylase-like metal-dependent hydrolase (beta-lactamase superfamily II)
MPDYKTTVGNVDLVSLSDGRGDMDPLEMFPQSTLEQWRSEYPDLLDDGRVRPRYGSVALRSGGRTVLVDTGMGAPDGTLLAEMAQRGVGRETIEFVVTTHLHPDHVGWNLSGGLPTFPNARYLVPKADWDYWTQPSVLAGAEHVRHQVMPLEGLRVMDLIEGEYRITDELTALPTPGHTPGHISIVIASGGQRGFVLGDVAHSPAQTHHTNWSPSFDVDQVLSRKTRHRVFDRLEADGSLVASGHFPAPGYGRLVRRDGRRVWQGV